MASEEFHLFPKLPTELRLKIWVHTIPIFPSLLPRVAGSSNDELRSTCRESRQIHNENYIPVFLPLARRLFRRPISRYALKDVDMTLYIDDAEILRRNFKDWIAPGPKGNWGIVELAVDKEVWKLRGPRRGEAHLESRSDARFMMLNPQIGLAALEVLTLVAPHPVMDVDKMVLGRFGQGLEQVDKGLVEDARLVFKTLNNLERIGLYAGWKEPELVFAVVLPRR
ncbi:uncharacterized protein L3040_000140 [Drepanopeziza brunnea f. sp. 'multigermtubi']|nr:hypothetical protein L3040_000140 [Drepanopeziza brunnea f. sp. 'multigermtubi']